MSAALPILKKLLYLHTYREKPKARFTTRHVMDIEIRRLSNIFVFLCVCHVHSTQTTMQFRPNDSAHVPKNGRMEKLKNTLKLLQMWMY